MVNVNGVDVLLIGNKFGLSESASKTTTAQKLLPIPIATVAL
jgi:hypothetical protein